MRYERYIFVVSFEMPRFTVQSTVCKEHCRSQTEPLIFSHDSVTTREEGFLWLKWDIGDRGVMP